MLARLLTRIGLPAVALALFLLPNAAPRARGAEAEAKGAGVAPLADHVPPHAILYLGWHGSQGLGQAYEGSHLKAVIDATDFKQLADAFVPQLIERLEKENKDAANAVRAALDLAKPMWKHPSAFVFSGVDWAADKVPTPHLALLCQAGGDAEKLEKELRTSIEDALKQAPGPLPVEVEVVRHGGLVAIVVGGEKAIFPAGDKGDQPAAASLASDEGFQSALAQVGKDPALVGYVDLDRIRDFVNTAVDRQGDDDGKRLWPRLRDALGVQGLHHAIWASGFDGKDWVDQAFVAAPEPRKGLLALADAAPISEEAFKSIPQTATLAGIGKIDAAKFVDTLRKIAGEVDPQVADIFDSGLKQVSDAVGINVEDDLLKSFGDEWVYYTDPRTGGRGAMGFVLINRLKDAEKAERSLTRLEKFANEQLQQQLKNEELKVSVQTTKSDGLTIHYLATPLITPSWAIHDGSLYVALFPQVVVAAADEHARGRDKSILDNKDFAALRERLGAGKATGLQFMDLPRTAPDSYAQWLMISRLSGIADLFGIKSPVMLAPPLTKLLPQLEAAGSASWVDKDGWHAKAVSPFPGATALATDPFSGGIGTESALVSVLLPSLNRAREQANRVKSASNLKQIGLAAILYANADKQGKFPKDLGEIYKTQELSINVFLNPRTLTPRPVIADRDKQAEWIEENSDYVWVGGGLKNSAGSEVVLAYEKPDGLADGIEVLYADGHVEFQPMAEAQKLIEAAQARKAGGDAPAGEVKKP